MPELPEVETVVRDLKPGLVGRTIIRVTKTPEAMKRAEKHPWDRILTGQTWRDVRRRGKWIIQEFASGANFLAHLGMTGQYQLHEANETCADHVHLELSLDNGAWLRFRDIRRFGALCYLPPGTNPETHLESEGLGPEPFGVDPGYWSETIRKSTRNLKALLLDQTVVAGVGNIYADESLFSSGLHPGRSGCQLSENEVQKLRKAVETILTKAVSGRGSTIRDYVGGSGLAGSFQNRLKVYGREGLPCPRCKTPIERADWAGRSSHYCPTCQPISRPAF